MSGDWGLFWRGPRSFTGGRVPAAGIAGGDELRGTRAVDGLHGRPAVDVEVTGVDALTGERVARVRLDAYDHAMVLTG